MSTRQPTATTALNGVKSTRLAYTTSTLTTDVYAAWNLGRHPQEEVASTRSSLHDIYDVDNDVYAAAYTTPTLQSAGLRGLAYTTSTRRGTMPTRL